MDDKRFKDLYGISEQDKTNLIKRLSQDISWDDDMVSDWDDLFNTEQDVSCTETNPMDEES